MSEIQKELAMKLEENQERQRKLQKLEYCVDIAMLVLTPIAIGTLGKSVWNMHKQRQQLQKFEPALIKLMEAIQKEE